MLHCKTWVLQRDGMDRYGFIWFIYYGYYGLYGYYGYIWFYMIYMQKCGEYNADLAGMEKL